MKDSLRIEFNAQELEASGGTIAVSFYVDSRGVRIAEHWDGMDEIHADGCSVLIPARIWEAALPWIHARLIGGPPHTDGDVKT